MEADSRYTIHQGDCRDVLATLPAESVQCVVTSPPYYGLRDYGTAQWDGGDPDCDHKEKTARNDGGRAKVDGFNGSARADSDKGGMNFRDVCGKCGAVRVDRQIGLEPTVDEYVARMVDVFRQVRRVLREDGTVWLNLGDSYAGGGGFWAGAPSSQPEAVKARGGFGSMLDGRLIQGGIKPQGNLKPKDLIGIPWRVAFALQADGWWLRSDIIWHKPNPMPESVTDRPTKAHEYVFLLSKAQRYYYDAESIKDPISANTDWTYSQPDKAARIGQTTNGTGATTLRVKPTAGARNRRSVWTVTTKPYSGAHFATMPPDLVEPCIRAGSKPGDLILDPFNGSGTTGAVALSLGRQYVGIELNPDYIALAHERIQAAPLPLFPEAV